MSAWPMLDPGKMVHWINIQKPTAGTDVSGATTVWRPHLQTWAQIDPIRGTDVLKAGQDTAQLFATVKIRFQHGIQPGMRVQTKNRLFLIQVIEDPGERNVILILNCIALSGQTAS